MRDPSGSLFDAGLPELFPGLGPDDPLKRETQAGFLGGIDALMPILYGRTNGAKQFVPGADVTLGTWTDELGGVTNIYTHINEPVANDSNYVTQHAGNLGSIYTFRFGAVVPVSAGMIGRLQVRVRQVLDAGPLDNTFHMQLQSPGGVDVATTGLTGSFVTITHALTAAEIRGLVGLGSGPSCSLSGSGTATHSHFDVSWAAIFVG